MPSSKKPCKVYTKYSLNTSHTLSSIKGNSITNKHWFYPPWTKPPQPLYPYLESTYCKIGSKPILVPNILLNKVRPTGSNSHRENKLILRLLLLVLFL